MGHVHPEFIVDQKDRKKSVVIPVAEWRRLMEAMEELEDIRAYDNAKPGDLIRFEKAVAGKIL
ncbi:MAG: hypothetical protein ABFD69_13955 [Candidatus Sumerlaeia bacterium]